MMKALFVVMMLVSCDEAVPAPDWKASYTSTHEVATFELDGSKCKVVEVSSAGVRQTSWWPITRITLCDPPLHGMCSAGSKPPGGKGYANLP